MSEAEWMDTFNNVYKMPDDVANAVACGMCERRAHEFGKTVREVCADFKAKYGGYL